MGWDVPRKAPDSLQGVNEAELLGQFPLVVVSNRLPVSYHRGVDGVERPVMSPGGLVAALTPALAGKKVAWVGWGGRHEGVAENTRLESVSLVSVPLPEKWVDEHYNGFSNQTIWPLFHRVGVEPLFSPSWWDSHLAVNCLFAEHAAELVEPGGTVWVHDYQLMVLPELIRALRPDVRIGYFHHIPFPPPGALEELPEARAIVLGLLGADLVGFQRLEDIDNFCTAVNQWGDLGVVSGHQVTLADARVVRVGAFPISIDFEAVSRSAWEPDVLERAQQLIARFGNRKILLGVDRIDYTKGIPERLLSFERLLSRGEVGVEDVVFVQAGSPSRENVESYRDLQEEINRIVARVNTTFVSSSGEPAIYYLAENLPREEMVALFVAAEVMVVTSLRDGMNLVAKEFVACKNDLSGVLVLSEFAGAADDMPEALIVDPTQDEELDGVLLEALGMERAEQSQRMGALRDRVTQHNVERWSTGFLQALHSTHVA